MSYAANHAKLIGLVPQFAIATCRSTTDVLKSELETLDIAAIGQASATNKKTSLVVSCEHCPMVWYHNLCTELEGLSEKAMEVQLSKYLESLPSQELAIVKMKLGGAEIPEGNASEHIQLVMMLLRAHCESKQARHVHDTPENR